MRRRALVAFSVLLVSMFTAAQTKSGSLLWIAPNLQNMTHNSVTVVWATNQPAAGIVGVQAGNGQVKQVKANAEQLPQGKWLYTAKVDGLLSGACYRYQVRAGNMDLTTPDQSFCTAPPPGTPFSFIAFGDSGTGLQSQANLATQLLRDHSDGSRLAFLLHMGDIAYPKGEYDKFASVHFAVYKALLQLLPVYPTAGNHEYYTDDGEPYRRLHVMPTNGIPSQDTKRYYSFDWGDVHFTVFDSNPGSPVTTSRFKEWLKHDLETTKARWKIVAFHVAAYSAGSHGPSSVTKALIPILESSGVDLVLQAHDHNIQRSVPLWQGKPAQDGQPGITYIVTGAGSQASYSCKKEAWVAYSLCGSKIPVYTRVSVAADRLIVEQVRETGAVIDRAVIPYQG